MKHYLLQTANGLHTPPCNNSHGKSLHFFNFRFSLFTPLLVLFLLIMGNSAAWGECSFAQGETIYFRLKNDVNWSDANAYPAAVFYYSSDSRKDTKTNTTNWDNMSGSCQIGSNNYTKLTIVDAGNKLYSITIPRNDIGYIRIVRISGGDANWTWNNQSKMSVTNAGTNNCIYCEGWDNTGAWETYNGGRTNTCSGGSDPELAQTNWSLHGDMWLNGTADDAGWIGGNDPRVPHFMDNGDGTATCSFIFPNAQCRLELYDNESVKTSDRCDGTTNITKSKFEPNKYYFDATGSTKKYTFKINTSTGRFTASAEAYPVQKTGWHVFLSAGDGDPTEVGTITEESGLVISDVSSGNHNLFITDGSANTIAGVNWFGGLYIDKNNSNVAWATQREYYGDSKFSSTQFPIRGKRNATGRFKLEEASDIIVGFDGGKITINKVEDATPTPSGVTYDGSEIFYFHKKGGSLNWGSVWDNNCALYLQFSNADESKTARSTKIGYFWDVDGTNGDILATRVPAGNWTKVRVLRNNNGDRNQTWNSSNYVTLEEGKNYLNDNNTMAVYIPRTFHFYISGSTVLASTGSDFNAWNGDGTAHSGSITKTLDAGTYKFKLNPTGTVDWRSEFNMDDLDAANSSNNINLRDGNNKEIWFDLDKRSEVTIACDGSKVTVVAMPAQQYTVTFNTDGGSTIGAVQVSDGSPVAQPADPTKAGYTFVKWQLDGSDYDFNSAVTGNIMLNAVWAYKGIESISLNESEHMTWDGNSDFTLTPTYSPSDVITKAVTWSSNNESVATVNNGIVHAVGAGTATITCTITDMLGNQRSATCEVTVAACEMSTSDLYTMTVTSYNTYSGDEAILTNFWNESTENDGPASMTICNIRIGNNGGSNEYYAYDNNGNVMIEQRSDNDVDKWYMIDAGTNLYYLKNVYTGKYMYCGPTNTTSSKGNGWSGNGDWYLRSVYTSTSNGETDNYKFYKAKDAWDNDIIVSRADASMGAKVAATDFVLSRQQLTGTPNVWSNVINNTVSASRGATQGGNSYKGFQSAFVNMENIPNPNYLTSQMNTSYYRMNSGATVKANLNDVLVKGAVITVRLYADAATSVQLTKVDGTTVIETINLTADTEFEYSYTVNNASPLLGESAFIIKAEDNHAGIASIEVTHTYVANPSNPELSWTDLSGDVTQSALGSTFRHVASSALSLGAIHYASSNEAVATVAADGTVTPHSAGTTTITATIVAEGCYDEASISYNITLTEASLQEAIDATPVDGILTLTHDYSENAVINKAITLDANGHTIGDLTVEYEGDLTLSSELTVRDFTIWAKAGNTSTPAASGQVRNASKLNVNGNAYFLYTVDPSGQVKYGWYDFTVPFPINIVSGIKGIQGGVLKEDFRNGVDYAVMEYFGEKQAQGLYPYKKFSGVMQPNKLYSITLDDSYNYNTLRMQKTADGALVASESVTLNAYAGDDINKNWNGVGNGTLHHANAGISGNYIQVYQSGDRTFLTVDKNGYSLVVGSAFMVQETGIMTLSQATHGALLAPSRYQSTTATTIQIASEGKPFSDQLFITASETGGLAYTPGVDVAKAGELGSASVPQIWTNAYNSSLCVHEAQLINGKAQYKLSIYAPVAGTYTLTSKNIPADYSLYLTQNGMIVSELSDTYTLDLSKGITTEYGLLLAEIYNSPTAIENTQTDKIQTTKIIRNGVLYILHNGKVYNAQGAMVK